MAESADATDLKSVGGNTVRVRPPLAPSLQYVIASGAEASRGNLLLQGLLRRNDVIVRKTKHVFHSWTT
jgi:hypothetical protein